MIQNAYNLFQNCWYQLSGLYETPEAQQIAYALLEDAFDVSRHKVVAKEDIGWSPMAESRWVECLDRLAQYEPIQYVTGTAHFMGNAFHCTQGILIPRPETEELVQWVLDDWKDKKPLIYDVGTGSGCIAVSLQLGLKTKAKASDISPSVIQVARGNAAELQAPVDFEVADFLNDPFNAKGLDVVISNPPYIPLSEAAGLDPNVRKFEPGKALFVPDADPLIFYFRMAEVGKEVLSQAGCLYAEIHEAHGHAVVDLWEQAGYVVELRQDLQGKDRMVRGQLSN